MVLKVGRKAPKFSLRDKDGERRGLDSFRTEKVVLYFYPKDDTPGCTLEAVEFSKSLAKFKQLGYSVVGISGGDDRSKAKFCLKHSLSVPLLSDPDFSVSESYGVYGEKMFMGRKYKGIYRTTFVVNVKSGLVEHVFEEVNPKGHSEEVLKTLGGASPAAKAKSAKPKGVKKPARASASKTRRKSVRPSKSPKR